MSVKIRLARLGKRGKPFYRIVVCDSHNKRDGKVVENVGTYNPLTEPFSVRFKKERVEYWLKKGAQLSDTVAHLYEKSS